MNDHYFIAADHGHVRIFQQQSQPGGVAPALVEVQSIDFPGGMQSYTARDTDLAGRFNSSKNQSSGAGAPVARTGMSIDERLPMQREEKRREAKDVSETIQTFLEARRDASWDFAAGPTLHNAVLHALPPDLRSRLRNVLPKDLVNQPVAELRDHFLAEAARQT